MKVLAVYWYPPGVELRPAVRAHLHALDGHGDTLVYHNAAHGSPRWLRSLRPDVVILHTTFLCLRWVEDFPRHESRFAWLADLDRPKIALPQDEYDHSEVLDYWLASLGVSRVYSNFGQSTREVLYPSLSGRVEFRRALTGYVDEEAGERLRGSLQPLAERPYDVVYRASQLPYWFGSHGQLKHSIGAAVAGRAGAHGLSTDISTRVEDVLLGDRWWDLLRSGRVVIGCESGSSVLDRRGEVQAQIKKLLAHQPGLSFKEVSDLMPDGWDSWSFFAISPRHLEAVLTKTCQVLVEGSYSGVLEPERHYIPLRRDLGDLDDVLERLRDTALLQRIADQAYEDIYLSRRYSYDAFAGELRAGIAGRRELSAATRVSSAVALAASRLHRAVVDASYSAPGRSVQRLEVLSPLVTDPVASARKLVLVARSVACRRRVRRLVRTYLGQPRAIARFPQFLSDLLRLEALSEAEGATLEIRDGSVVVTALSGGTGAVDHGDLESALAAGSPVMWVGEDDTYYFEALTQLARTHPQDAARALSDAVARHSASAG